MLNVSKAMGYAYRLAKNSPDPSNQNGAAVYHPDFGDEVFGAGYNGFGRVPYGESDLADRDWKLKYIEHAERAALYDCVNRNPSKGLILVCPWACCTDCGRAIGRMGVSKLIVHTHRMDTTPERWVDSVKAGLDLVELDGCEIEYYSGPLDLPEDFTIRANGADWNPHTGETV